MLILTLQQYNDLYDLLMKVKREGNPEQRKAAQALLITLHKPEAQEGLSEEKLEEYYKDIMGSLPHIFPN